MQQNGQKIRYLRLSEKDLKIEQKEEFGSSIFADVYEKTEKIIREIICKPEERDYQKQKSSSYDAEKGNIITFLGERGSGKSSVLSTILNYLEKTEDFKHACFIPLEMLDVSLLEQEEDVFDLILAALVKKFDELNERSALQLMDDTYKKQKFQEKFDSVYEKHHMLRFEKKDELIYEHSALFALRQLSSSKQIKKELCDLVQMFLDLVVRFDRKPYLVVAVDDLDMNIDHAFEILEQVNRYLTIKNVIVMIAVKYEQMEYVCERHFAKILPKMNRELESNRADYIRVTANEYLDKVMPLQNRVYIPVFSDGIMNCSDNLQIDKEKASIKKTVLGKIARRTNIYLDGCGEERHFMEPMTLRELNDYYYFLNRLPKLYQTDTAENREQTDTQIRRYNCERFIQDIMNRYIYRYLSPDDRDEFKRIAGMNIDMRNKYLRAAYSGDNKKFGYGDLLWMLCKKNENRYDNSLLNCILLLYTCILNNEVHVFTDNGITEEERSVAKDHFEKIAHASLAGLWANEFTPVVPYTSQTDIADIRKAHIGNIFSIRSKENDVVYGIECETDNLNGAIIRLTDWWMKWVQEHKKELNSFEAMILLIERIANQSERPERIEIKICVKKAEGSSTKDHLLFFVSNYKIDYNALAFIKNSFEYKHCLGEFYEALASAMLPGKTQMDEDYKKLVDKIRETSLYQEYEAWYKNGSNGIVVPFQYTDIYYHMLLRIRERYLGRQQYQIRKSTIFDAIQNLYQDIEAELRKQDEFYSNNGNITTNFYRYFKECPFIKVMLDTKRQMPGFAEQFSEAILNGFMRSADVERNEEAKSNVEAND